MKIADATLRLDSNGGKSAGGASSRRRGAAAAAGAAAALIALAGCAASYHSEARRAAALQVHANVESGLDLYESGELVLAARRFHEAADQAGAIDERELERKAVASECVAWLRARRMDELSECTMRLESLQRRAWRPDPAVNTLIAFGSIAGHRPLSALRIPNAVQPLVHGAAKESQ